MSSAASSRTKPDLNAWSPDGIPAIPHMEREGRLLLQRHLRRVEVFLEYGSGGSSVMALRSGVRRIYSVESDRKFLEAVRLRLVREGATRGQYVPMFVDIGRTKAWGRPVDETRARQWPAYCSAPWARLRAKKEQPGLVLIDGRFRVACFLLSALMAQPGCIILFDDYFNRSYYHVVEKYFTPSRAAGRLAEFVIDDFPRADLAIIDLLAYSTQFE